MDGDCSLRGPGEREARACDQETLSEVRRDQVTVDTRRAGHNRGARARPLPRLDTIVPPARLGGHVGRMHGGRPDRLESHCAKESPQNEKARQIWQQVFLQAGAAGDFRVPGPGPGRAEGIPDSEANAELKPDAIRRERRGLKGLVDVGQVKDARVDSHEHVSDGERDQGLRLEVHGMRGTV
jgi:hypothetical protein